MTDNIKETLPWSFTGSFESIPPEDGSKKLYAIGAIVSERLGCAIAALSFDGDDMEKNIAKLDEVGKFIVACCNKERITDA